MVTPDRLRGPSGLVLDLNRRAAVVDGVPIKLKRREIDLLATLLRERGRVVPFAELSQRAWGQELVGDARFIYTTAWRLRTALEAAGATDVIESIRGVGYMVSEEDRPATAAAEAEFGESGEPCVFTPACALVIFDPTDPFLRVSMANEVASQLSGYNLAALTQLEESALHLWSAEDRVLIDEAVKRAVATGESETSGRRLLCAGGRTVAVNIRMRRLDRSDQSPLILAEVWPAEA